MSLPFSSIALRLPAGFQTLLEGLALEVLRAQPADVVAFAAQHFQTLLEQREESSADPAAWGARLEDELLTQPPFQEPEKDKEKEDKDEEEEKAGEQAGSVASTHRARPEESALRRQAAPLNLPPAPGELPGKRDPAGAPRPSLATHPSSAMDCCNEGACTKLDEDILDIPLDDPDANAAAAKIQASFRGHMTRKKIKGGEIDRKTKDAECANSTRGGDLRNGD
ncbi:unnamed protein product [Bubo scandiacus]